MMGKLKINHNLENNMIINRSENHTTPKTIQSINIAISNEVIGAFQHTITTPPGDSSGYWGEVCIYISTPFPSPFSKYVSWGCLIYTTNHI